MNDQYKDGQEISLLAEDQYRRELAWREVIEPLTQEEEGQLLRRVQRGRDERVKIAPNQWVLNLAAHARTRLIEAYQPVVLNVAKAMMSRRVRGGGMELLDLVQEGNVGLLWVVDECEHDLTRIRSLTALIITSVRFRMLTFLSDGAPMVRVPVTAQGDILRLRQIEGRFLECYGRLPSYVELAQELRVSVVRVARLVEYSYLLQVVSLQGLQRSTKHLEEVSEDRMNFVSLFEQVAIEETRRGEERCERVRQAVETSLTTRQQTVVNFRYGLDAPIDMVRSWKEVGECAGMSEEVARGNGSVSRAKLARVLAPLVEREAVSA